MTGPIIISSASIKINSDGLYCLNDLHKAGGSEEKHKPNHWLRLDSTKSLEMEILNAGYPAIKKESGRYGGSYVCKHMVYAYAMWISPEFSFEVIDFFDRNKRVETDLNALVSSVRAIGESLGKQIDVTSLTIDEMNGHASNWGCYGSAIKKAKKECRIALEDLKDRIQMKLDLS